MFDSPKYRSRLLFCLGTSLFRVRQCSARVRNLLAVSVTVLWFLGQNRRDALHGLASTTTNISLLLSKYDIHGAVARVVFSFSKAAWCF